MAQRCGPAAPRILTTRQYHNSAQFTAEVESREDQEDHMGYRRTVPHSDDSSARTAEESSFERDQRDSVGGAEQTSEPFRRLLLVPCAAGDGTDCLLCLINARIWRPSPPVHLNEQTERHPRSPLVAVQKGVVLGETNEKDTRLVNESGQNSWAPQAP